MKVPETKFNEADGSLNRESIIGVLLCVVVLLLPNKGEEETVVLETRFGVLKSVGDSVESKVVDVAGELLSLNNNPVLLLLGTNFAPSAFGTGRCRLRSFAAMMSMGLGCVASRGMGPPTG